MVRNVSYLLDGELTVGCYSQDERIIKGLRSRCYKLSASVGYAFVPGFDRAGDSGDEEPPVSSNQNEWLHWLFENQTAVKLAVNLSKLNIRKN